MGSDSREFSDEWDKLDSSAHEDKFCVSVRLRPLNEKELAKNDVAGWECINNTTIIFKNSVQDRSILPTVYTFDRVFDPEISTRKVYEEAAKRIALSVLSGLNSSIFAYGQTSSGKTYTMSGITEYAIADIYNYIEHHHEREYMLRFSALEIYNEIVNDLLSPDGAPRRLLDDPVRGTVVEKLTEVEVRDLSHLKELLSFCQAQRRIGETALNEVSSRSHQILCLTVESDPLRCFGTENASTLMASVNFVDLAGSERSSQTAAVGMRLKEGSHINRSLLTLGTVIRKLSNGRTGHIPFRDSKLTRILQNSLGGNARTAIICTMSPAHSHVDQSKSTLVFANCAKRISTHARVNAITPEKALVKQLRREIARLENEVRMLSSLAASGDSVSTPKDKELVEKLSKEIRQLTHQHDLIQPHTEDIFHPGGASHASTSMTDLHNHERGSWTDECSSTSPFHSNVSSWTSYFSDKCGTASSSQIEDPYRMSFDEEFLLYDTSPRLYIDKYFGPLSPPDPGWEDLISGNELEGHLDELPCIEFDFNRRNTAPGISLTHKEDKNSGKSSVCSSDEDVSDPSVSAPGNEICSELAKENEERSQNDVQIQGRASDVQPEVNNEHLQTIGSLSSAGSDRKNGKEENIETFNEGSKIKQQESCMDVEPETNNNLQQTKDAHSSMGIDFKNVKEEAIKRFKQSFKIMRNLVSENGRTSDRTNERSDKNQDAGSASDWHTKFEKQKLEIIELWTACNVPLVYRTYFFLLFKGDPSDTVYMEVELRRLSFLKNKLYGTTPVRDDQIFTEATSAKALSREREMLSRQMLRKFSGKERKALYRKWGIDLKTKRRRLQLCRKLWTDTKNMEHVKESAAIVAKLIGFKDTGNAPKEMIAFSFLQKPDSIRPSSWKIRRHSLPSLI